MAKPTWKPGLSRFRPYDRRRCFAPRLATEDRRSKSLNLENAIALTWKPDSSDYFDAFQGQNPWHSLGQVPEGLSYNVRRPLAAQIWRTLVDAPWRFQVILGPRRVGKTVCLYQTVQQLIEYGIPPRRLWFMRMDHPLFLDFPLGGWVRALINREKPTAEKPLYLFLDEVNYAEKWDLWLKTFHDEKWPVQIVATSSSVAALRSRRIESGVGRWSEQFLTPYNFLEFLDVIGAASKEIDAGPSLSACMESVIRLAPELPAYGEQRLLYMLVGGFPEILLNELDVKNLEKSMLRSQQTLRSEAVQRVTGMDLPQVFGVQQPIALERLLYLLAGQMGEILSGNSLAQTLGLTRQTVNQYVDYLEKAFLVFTLPRYAASEETVQRRGRKVYFVDGAVRNAALQRGVGPLTDPTEKAFLTENAAASHLYALAVQNGARLFHWRQNQQEVDFVYDHPNDQLAFEVTSSVKHHLKGINAFRERYPAFRDRCYLVSAQSTAAELPRDNAQGIGRIPLDLFLIAVGGCIGRALADRLSTD